MYVYIYIYIYTYIHTYIGLPHFLATPRGQLLCALQEEACLGSWQGLSRSGELSSRSTACSTALYSSRSTACSTQGLSSRSGELSSSSGELSSRSMALGSPGELTALDLASPRADLVLPPPSPVPLLALHMLPPARGRSAEDEAVQWWLAGDPTPAPHFLLAGLSVQAKARTPRAKTAGPAAPAAPRSRQVSGGDGPQGGNIWF